MLNDFFAHKISRQTKSKYRKCKNNKKLQQCIISLHHWVSQHETANHLSMIQILPQAMLQQVLVHQHWRASKDSNTPPSKDENVAATPVAHAACRSCTTNSQLLSAWSAGAMPSCQYFMICGIDSWRFVTGIFGILIYKEIAMESMHMRIGMLLRGVTILEKQNDIHQRVKATKPCNM